MKKVMLWQLPNPVYVLVPACPRTRLVSSSVSKITFQEERFGL